MATPSQIETAQALVKTMLLQRQSAESLPNMRVVCHVVDAGDLHLSPFLTFPLAIGSGNQNFRWLSLAVSSTDAVVQRLVPTIHVHDCPAGCYAITTAILEARGCAHARQQRGVWVFPSCCRVPQVCAPLVCDIAANAATN